MAEKILCYGIKSKFGLIQVEEITFDNLGKPGYDYQVAFKTISEHGGNGSFDLILIKESKETQSLEIDGWKFEKFCVMYNWGYTSMRAKVTDCIGETQELELASGKGSASKQRPSNVELIRQGFEGMKYISTFGSINMFECVQESISMYPTSLSGYIQMLNSISEFCQKAEEIRDRLRDNPEDKDIAAYNNVLKPKLIEYMKSLSKVEIDPERLDLQ